MVPRAETLVTTRTEFSVSKHMQGVQTFSIGYCVYSCSSGIYCIYAQYITIRAPMGTGSLPGVRCGRGVTLTPHPLLVPRSKIE
jgi:hypothetical protein